MDVSVWWLVIVVTCMLLFTGLDGLAERIEAHGNEAVAEELEREMPWNS